MAVSNTWQIKSFEKQASIRMSVFLQRMQQNKNKYSNIKIYDATDSRYDGIEKRMNHTA